jgi:PPK2 family polyphosphate:nucleotide phosphotransferase
VVSFKEPTHEELSHDFLWRVHRQVPPKGSIGIFNRSHYEDVLVTRVHHLVSRQEAQERCKEIKRFEKLLLENGTRVVKFFLHISKDEQRERLQARVDNPQKRWKFSPADVTERQKWNAYQQAYEETLGATSTKEAPWYIVPANRKWYRNWVIAKVLVDLLEDMDPRFPRPAPQLHFSKITIR